MSNSNTKIDLASFVGAVQKVEKGKHTSLGRGLSALMNDAKLTPENQADALKGFDIVKIKISDCIPSRYQARKNFSMDGLSDLSDSIAKKGVLQPILVRKQQNKYEIIAGERRCRASTMAGIETIPAIIMEVNDRLLMEIGLIENLQRKDLNPVEEADSYKQLIDVLNYSHDDIGKLVGKSRSYITNYLRMLSLPMYVLDLVAKGSLSVGHAKMMVGAEDPIKLANQILENNLNVRETEELAQVAKEIKLNVDPLKPTKNIHKKVRVENQFNDDVLKSWHSSVQENYPGVFVRSKKVGKNGGEIVIKYKNVADLKALLNLQEK